MWTALPLTAASSVLLLVLASAPAAALPITLDPPRDGEFVRDLAGLIRPNDEEKLNRLGRALLGDAQTPLLVVTIESMARRGGAGLRIETFATLLFDQWGIGDARRDGEPWNTGILLLVSEGDRKARIELGAGWRREYDRRAERIMQERIIPRFRAGDFSGGILAGAEALDRMAREAAPALRGGDGGPVPAAVSAPPPLRPEEVPVERPAPAPGRAGASAPASPPPPRLDPDALPVEPPPAPGRPRSPSAPSSPRRTSDDGVVYPSGGSSSGPGIGALVPLIIFVVIAFSVISKIRRGMRGFGMGTGHRTASALPLLLGLLAGSRGGRGYRSHGWSSGPSRHTSGGSSFWTTRSGSGSSSFGSSSRGGSSGGSRSSFGGGFSGGGGATGSW